MVSEPGWRFVHFGLLVTGKGEQQFLPDFFRALTASGRCTFEIIRGVQQLSPRASEQSRPLTALGTGKRLPSRDEEIGIAARSFLKKKNDAYVLLVDDLEHARREQHQEIFERYRGSFDTMLREESWRASVHFLVMMVEAYYFAHADAVNQVLGTALSDHEDDVESIRHPKNQLKKVYPGFREVAHGKEIVKRLDLEHVLGDPNTCASLRTAVAWCWKAMGLPDTQRFRLDTGRLHAVTSPQLVRLDGGASR